MEYWLSGAAAAAPVGILTATYIGGTEAWERAGPRQDPRARIGASRAVGWLRVKVRIIASGSRVVIAGWLSYAWRICAESREANGDGDGGGCGEGACACACA